MSSWKANDLVKPVWLAWGKKHGVSRAARDEFAKTIGTSGTVLSALNTGSTLMTSEMAERIAKEGDVSVLELGAPEEEADEKGQSLLDRLRQAEAEVDELRGLLIQGFAALKPLLPRSQRQALEVPPSPRPRAQSGNGKR